MAREEIDGGEAVLEAFRNLDIEYIIASPGSDWPSVWEALARQKVNEADGPRYIDTWHETLAVTMAMAAATLNTEVPKPLRTDRHRPSATLLKVQGVLPCRWCCH